MGDSHEVGSIEKNLPYHKKESLLGKLFHR